MLLVVLLALSVILTSLTVYAYLVSSPEGILRGFRFAGEAKAVVAVVRADRSNVSEALREAFELLNLENLIKPGFKVMVKPNVVRSQEPPDTVHPATVEALVELLKSMGVSEVVVAEGSGEGNTMENFDALGYFEMASKTGVELLDLNFGELMNVTIPNGRAFKSMMLNKRLFEVDVFISLACMKTHSDAVVTLGLKNLIGIAPGSVYGIPKAALHEADSRLGGTYMAAPITDLAKARPINLTIIDGIVAMEGLGPHRGTPVNMGVIIVGEDPVATDSIAELIMGFDPRLVPTTRMAAEDGLGVCDPAYIEVRGVKVEDVFRPFSVASSDHQRFQVVTRENYILYESRTSLLTASIILWALTATLTVLHLKLRKKP